jgi:hypothetical protein
MTDQNRVDLPHEWTFTAASAGRDAETWAIAIAICVRCGETRAAQVDALSLDLSGDCRERRRRQG